MRSTLFHIPTQIAGLPLFGEGILYWAILGVGLLAVVRGVLQRKSLSDVVFYALITALGMALMRFVAPSLLEADGFPIRGYGVFLTIAIAAAGGLDLAVLGLGDNAHIGYNEPGTPFDSRTHVQKLTERTKRQLLKRGFTDKDMPDLAVTMGIRSLTEARGILLLASGAEKAAAVYQMLYAKTTSYIPAAFLQIPSDVTVLLDREASAEL